MTEFNLQEASLSSPEDGQAKIFGYIFSDDSFENRKKVLDYFVENLVQEDAALADVFEKMKLAAEQVGEIPSHEYVSKHMGYTMTLSTEGVVNCADALAIIQEEVKKKACCRLISGSS